MSMPSSSALVEIDAAHLSCAKPAFDLAPPHRQIPAAIPANQLRHAGHIFEILLEICRENFGRQAALRKHDHLQVATQKFPRHTPRFG